MQPGDWYTQSQGYTLFFPNKRQELLFARWTQLCVPYLLRSYNSDLVQPRRPGQKNYRMKVAIDLSDGTAVSPRGNSSNATYVTLSLFEPRFNETSRYASPLTNTVYVMDPRDTNSWVPRALDELFYSSATYGGDPDIELSGPRSLPMPFVAARPERPGRRIFADQTKWQFWRGELYWGSNFGVDSAHSVNWDLSDQLAGLFRRDVEHWTGQSYLSSRST